MNKKILKLVSKSGFCVWTNEPWKPEGAIIDWSCNYDKAFIDYTKRLLKSVAKKNHLNYDILINQHGLDK